jgi:hypothetical protein
MKWYHDLILAVFSLGVIIAFLEWVVAPWLIRILLGTV